MTSLMTNEQAEAWLDHPMIRHVSDTYAPADTLELLEGLHLLCCEMEDRFPGMRFREILSTSSTPSPWATLRALVNAGTSPEDLAVIFDRFTYHKPSPYPGASGRFDSLTLQVLDDTRDLGHSLRALADAGYGKTAAQNMHFAFMCSLSDDQLHHVWGGVKRIRERAEKQPVWDEIVYRVIACDENMADAGRAIGLSSSTVNKVCLAFLYQLWLATEGRLP